MRHVPVLTKCGENGSSAVSGNFPNHIWSHKIPFFGSVRWKTIYFPSKLK